MGEKTLLRIQRAFAHEGYIYWYFILDGEILNLFLNSLNITIINPLRVNINTHFMKNNPIFKSSI